MWGEITYPFINFYSTAVEILETAYTIPSYTVFGIWLLIHPGINSINVNKMRTRWENGSFIEFTNPPSLKLLFLFPLTFWSPWMNLLKWTPAAYFLCIWISRQMPALWKGHKSGVYYPGSSIQNTWWINVTIFTSLFSKLNYICNGVSLLGAAKPLTELMVTSFNWTLANKFDIWIKHNGFI